MVSGFMAVFNFTSYNISRVFHLVVTNQMLCKVGLRRYALGGSDERGMKERGSSFPFAGNNALLDNYSSGLDSHIPIGPIQSCPLRDRLFLVLVSRILR